MGKSGHKKKEMDSTCDGNGDEEEQLALTLSRPTKRQKKLFSSANDLLILPTKFFNWLRHKFIRPLLFRAPSYSSSDLIPFNSNSNSSSSGASGIDLLQPSKYDLFISFRGSDVRDTFLSHLYTHLNDLRKLAVYKDDVDLPRGMEISATLLQAIERSDVYVVILSPNYADSSWCLDELVKILECKERHGRSVIPVFYGVDPSDIENQKLPIATTASIGEVQSWRSALRAIANLSGFDSKVIRPETKLMEAIAEAVFQAIPGGSQDVSTYLSNRGLVGLDWKVVELERLMCLKGRSGNNNRKIIGIWGMAGIGKTLLAKVVFDLFSCQFEASYFFSNFAERVASAARMLHGHDLQSFLFSKLLGDDIAGGGSFYLALRRLDRMKALVVIDDVGDDVGDIGPLRNLFNGQYCHLFGPGSRIIITSRNQQLLKIVCDHVYEVKALDDEEAFRLFCLHAFKGDHPQSEYMEMALSATRYASGHPLAITVLGAHLYNRDLKFWDLELKALQDNPISKVENVLRRSYDGLSRAEKDAFLDLACFDKCWLNNDTVSLRKLLSDGRENIITKLVDKSLICIDIYDDSIEMNPLLIDLGCNIVTEERQIEKRSRIWKAEDICYIFRENKGTQSTRGIILCDTIQRARSTYLQTNAFAKMESLQHLVINDIAYSDDGPSDGGYHKLILPKDGLKSLPNTLKILVWYLFASKCLPSQFSAENLITLNLTGSEIELLWEDDELNVDLRNLKSLLLTECKSLRKLSDLSTAKRLETIDLSSCYSLVELPTSILDLPELKFLDVSDCSNLKFDNLEDYVNSSREQSGRHSDFLPNLTELNLSGIPFQKVPNFITQLHILDLRCYGCTELTEFPIVPSLQRLSLTNSLIEEVVELEKLTELQSLDLCGNEQLILISGDFSKLRSLKTINLIGCSKLSRLPDNIGDLIHLDDIGLSDTALRELPSSFGNLIKLSELNLNGCKSLASLPDSISKLTNLNCIDLSCTALTELPSSIGNFVRLSTLFLSCCKRLRSLPDAIHKLPGLDRLDLVGCDQLRHLPELLSSLTNLDASGCMSLQTLSAGIIENYHFRYVRRCFASCWKLDPVVCSKLVDKFAMDPVPISSSQPKLLLPAKWGSESGSDEGSTMGSNNSNHITMATAMLRGQPWKPKRIIFCALLNSPDPLLINQNDVFYVKCVMLNSSDNPGRHVSLCYWVPYQNHEDPVEEYLSTGYFLIWSDDSDSFVDSNNKDDGSTFKLLFRLERENGLEVPNLIKDCRVIPVYDDRTVMNEDGEEEEDDDQPPNYLQGLYDEMCAHVTQSRQETSQISQMQTMSPH